MALKKALQFGSIVATPGAIGALTEAGVRPDALLARHGNGDWGDLDDEDKAMSDRAAEGEGRVLSAYMLHTGERIWIITEWDRSVTTILLPKEY